MFILEVNPNSDLDRTWPEATKQCPKGFKTLDDALLWLEQNFVHIVKCIDNPVLQELNGPDPEDDQILIREFDDKGNSKIVWHFSGWHYDTTNLPEQGCLLGHKLSLYDEVLYGFSR